MKIEFETEQELLQAVKQFHSKKQDKTDTGCKQKNKPKKQKTKKMKKRKYKGNLKITPERKQDIENRLSQGENKSSISKSYKKVPGWVQGLIKTGKINDTRQ